MRSLWGALSRGTESLIFAGRVPPTEFQRMRSPHMGGNFPFPVKYGYSIVGLAETGPAESDWPECVRPSPPPDSFQCTLRLGSGSAGWNTATPRGTCRKYGDSTQCGVGWRARTRGSHRRHWRGRDWRTHSIPVSADPRRGCYSGRRQHSASQHRAHFGCGFCCCPTRRRWIAIWCSTPAPRLRGWRLQSHAPEKRRPSWS